MLIDTGDNTKVKLIQNYFTKRGIEKIDYAIFSHPDSDHIGGAAVIVIKFEIDNAGQAIIGSKEPEAPVITYVLNEKSKKFHLISCGSLPTENWKDTTETRKF